MKIAYIGSYNPSEKLSGPEKVAKRIFEKSSEQNKAVFIEYFSDGSKYTVAKKLLGKEIVDYSNGLKIFRLGLLRILPFLFKLEPQIIHVITFERFSILSYLYKVFSKVKIVYNVHGIAVYENENFKKVKSTLRSKDSFCEKIFMKFSSKLLFLSEYQLSIAKRYYDVINSKVEFINNGVDKEFNIETKSSNTNKIPSLVFIGDSERKDKDFNYLYSSLLLVNTHCKLFIIGEFNSSVFKNTVGNVTIVQVNKMDKSALIIFLSDKDIFVSSSFYDTFSIATAECMTLGLVPVVTDHTGISKILKNNENGFIVKHGDINELANKINLLVENAELRGKISQNSRKIFEELNWEKVYTSYEKIYQSVIRC